MSAVTVYAETPAAALTQLGQLENQLAAALRGNHNAQMLVLQDAQRSF